MAQSAKSTPDKPPPIYLLTLLVLFLVLYISVRFNWRWLTFDAETLTMITSSLFDTASLSGPGLSYDHGFAYPALNVTLSHITGVPVSDLQVFIQPFLIVLLVPVAYITINALTGSHQAAYIATLFLFLQAEFLFEAVRSSHAKVTWLMALTMVYLLVKGSESGDDTRKLIKWVVLFYLAAFALISSNSFFASNYILSIALAFLGGRILKRFKRSQPGTTGKLFHLLFVTLSCGILVFLFIFYLYPPALRLFHTLGTIQDRLAALFLDVETEAVNPYTYVSATWTSTEVYFALTFFSWAIFGLSFFGWLRSAYKIIVRRGEIDTNHLLLWLFYLSFAVLMVLSVLLDIAGVLSANLQVRVFPNLMIFAIPLASLMLVDFMQWLNNYSPFYRKTAAALVLALVYASGASMLKVSNEPLLSNQWTFSLPGESRVLSWLTDRQQYAFIWSGFDHRLTHLSRTIPSVNSRDLINISLDEIDFYRQHIPYYLVSELTIRQAARMGLRLPDLRHDTFRLYDNGQAWIIKTVPKPLTRNNQVQ